MPKEWNKLTWKDIDNIDKNSVLLLPIGSCEQHSLHLPVGMDFFSAERIARDVSGKIENAYVLPGIPYGVSEHHMDFLGTITVSSETLIMIVYDIVSSLKRHGFSRIFIINGHGGNTAPLNVALGKIRENLGLVVYLINPWELIGDYIKEVLESDVWGHACEFETSVAMHIIPNLVRRENIKDPEINMDVEDRIKKVHMPWHTIEITNTGSIGYPTKASEEKGKKLYEKMLDETIKTIKELLSSNY